MNLGSGTMVGREHVAWVCVHFALPGQMAGLREDLGGPSLTVIERDASAVRTDGALFDLMSEAFGFPDYFGRNWDALDECLTDMDWLPAAGYLLVLTGTAAFWRNAPATAGKLISAWQFAAEQWRRENTPFHLVFLPQPCGCSRIRWDSMMSIYKAGWIFIGLSVVSMVVTVHLISIFGLQLFYFIFVMGAGLGSASLFLFQCPNCRRSIFMRGPLLCTPWPARICSKCRTDLSKAPYFDQMAPVQTCKKCLSWTADRTCLASTGSHMDLEGITREYRLHGRISRRSVGALKELIRGDDPYSAITVAGDCAAFDASPEIGLCLESDDPMVRWNAVGVLFTRFRQPDLGGRCLALAKSDPDVLVRAISLCGIGEILHKITDTQLRAEMARTLLQTVAGASALPEIRGAAYDGILAAMDVLPLDRPPASRLLDPDKDVDQELVQAFRATFVI